MDALSLIHLQLAIECIGLDPEGMLVRIPGPDPDEIGQIKAYRHAGGYTAYCRQDLPASLLAQVRTLGAESAFHDREAVKAILAVDCPCTHVEVYHTYVFPDTRTRYPCPDVVRLGAHHAGLIQAYNEGMDVVGRAVFAVIRDGKIVSTCVSARENDSAGECSVFTLPEYRRRGHGRQVTAAWGAHLRQEGKVAFYSHTEENLASLAVAQSLGLRHSFVLVNYE